MSAIMKYVVEGKDNTFIDFWIFFLRSVVERMYTFQ